MRAKLFIFKVGPDSRDFDSKRIKRMVEAYDPKNYMEAPVAIGHRASWNQTKDEDEYAHGWIRNLEYKSQKVYADAYDLSPEIVQKIIEKKLKYISIEIIPFDKIEGSEKPPYLACVCFLGRNNPGIRKTGVLNLFGLGLKQFFTQNEGDEERIIYTRKIGKEDIIAFQQDNNNTKEEVLPVKPDEYQTKLNEKEKEKEIEKLKAQNEAFQVQLNGKETNSRQKAENFYNKLRDDGKLAPALFEKTLDFDTSLNMDQQQAFRELMENQSQIIDPNGAHFAKTEVVDEGFAGKSVNEMVQKYQNEKNIATYEEAAIRLYKTNPQLFKMEEDNG